MRIAALLPLLLAACSSLVPSTLMRLQALDPLTADPSGIELALVLPDGLRPQPQGARLEFKADRTGHSVAETFVLEPRPAPSLPEAKGVVMAFGLSRADAARMRAAQSAVAAWPQDGQSHGSLGVALDACLTGGPLPPTAEGGVLIKLEQEQGFQPLVRPAPIAALIGAEAMAGLRPCGNPALP
ncbi:MAG: hypothetical protein BGP11_02895 [Rhodobacterales bacterium 65-51]|uniref:hypothetical protein n=1 Tax=uncultured Gemmobacter sp. TaxID=1095917 RepID=UPI000969E9A8|nr:hypothetical protein [uncultured Gemmobacter sp.]OJY32331.1 MAG: hypothetical protein BGP11_02895 [Rhodobacterales bacterium 65-51]